MKLTALTYLNISSNKFLFPNKEVELLSNFSKLKELNLSNNHISKLPDGAGNWMNIQKLDISFNEIGSLPVTFSNLQQMKVLNMSKNEMTNLTYEMTKLSSLEILDLSYNHISELDGKIGTLPSLKVLDASHNAALNTIRNDLYNSASLKMLVLRSTSLSDAQISALLQNIPEIKIIQ
jgi:Leucine-rich repeat (LRR) protein